MKKEIKKIGIWGASITQGYNDFELYGWVNRLRELIKSDTKPFYIYNLGISGDMSDDIVNRFELEATARKVDTAIIAIGINDSAVWVESKENRVSTHDYKNNLEKLVKIANKLEIEIVFVSSSIADDNIQNPCPWCPDIIYSTEQIFRYNKVMEEVSINNHIQFINLFDSLSVLDLHDGLHPNAKGHQKIAEQLAESIIL